MKYVIIRDDDTCALTPVECLDRLYRPFLDRRLPVNLATIPNVNTRATWADGTEEGFLWPRRGDEPLHLPIGSNQNLLKYLRAHPQFTLLHHGFDHTYLEFAQTEARLIAHKLEEGRRFFQQAGIAAPRTFVAPYDQLSRAANAEVAKRFRVLSTGWFQWNRIPRSWWPAYLQKKWLRRSHWQAGGLTLLSHPGCLLSHKRPVDSILPAIKTAVGSNPLTILVTHWWEYFHGGRANTPFISVLHDLARWLHQEPDVRVISLTELENPASAVFREIFSGRAHPVHPGMEPEPSII